ncbi:SDR family NAD(P)-dependent oxidoreductase [Candidatus Binatia bacterium]|nr:SDR family NAD(P)-dependent oxidoreductase [Candidatus Binatia bacterium]
MENGAGSAGERTALVTGGGRGIGRAIALALAADGFRVLAVGRDLPRLRAVAAEAAGIDVYAADLAIAAERDRLISHAAAWAPRLSLLVNNAAVQHDGGLEATAAVRAERALQLNLLAPIALAAGLLAPLQAGQGTVVNVTSILARHPRVTAPVYCGTKAGLRVFTIAFRDLLRDRGVAVVELVPPLVDTDMTSGRGRRKIPPEEVARALLAGLHRGAERIDVGWARPFRWIDRLCPALAARIVRNS